MWDETDYPFPNFNDCTIEIRERISNLLLHFIMDLIDIHAVTKGNACWYKKPQVWFMFYFYPTVVVYW